MTASDMPDDAHKSGMTPSAAGEEAAQSQILPAAASDVEAHSTEKTTASDGDVEQQLISEVAKAKKPFAFFLALTCLLITTFLAALDSTCMAVSIATITDELSGTTFEAFWASLAYLLADVITLPLYASASNVLGRMIPLYTSILFFFIGSIVFATAQSMPTLIAGRLLQGLGGGGLDALNEILIVDITTLKERPLYLGIMAIPMALGTIAGPLMGAAFTEYVTWRWLGWVNLPLLGIDVILAVLFLRLQPIDEPLRARFARVDWIGSIVFALGASALALPLSWADNLYAWSSWRTIVPLLIGIATLVGFAVYEARPQAPLFPYRLFRSRTSLMTLVTATIHGLIIYPATTYVPLFFQSVKLQTPLASAISMLPSCCGVIGFALLSGVAVEITRRYTWQFWASWVFIAVGMGLFSRMDQASSVAQTAGFQILAGVGFGALFTVPPLAVQADVAVEDQGLAVGILAAFRLFGALVGLAIGSTVFASVFERSLSDTGSALLPLLLPDVAAALRSPSGALAFIPRLRDLDVSSETRDEIVRAYAATWQTIWYVMAAFSCLGFATSWFIRGRSIETEDVGRQHIQHGHKEETRA